MRILMLGAGGVGGYFGGRLAAAGEDVTFIARGAHLAAMTSNGLRIESPLGDAEIKPVSAQTTARGLAPVEVAFIAVKIGDTAAAIEACRDAVGPDTVVISLQNGLAADDELIAAFGAGRVAGGVAYIASEVAAPGLIRHIGANQRIQVGELPAGTSARIARIAASLAGAGIDAEAVPDITRAMWEKFVLLVALAGLTTLTGETIGTIRADPDMRALLHAVMAETAAVARARGIDFAGDYADGRLAFADTLPEDMRSSMHHDLAAGRPLELDWLSGAVVRMGAALGIPTPANAAVYAGLKPRRFGADAAS
jgi:2-dehydropantoate 2-reductase